MANSNQTVQGFEINLKNISCHSKNYRLKKNSRNPTNWRLFRWHMNPAFGWTIWSLRGRVEELVSAIIFFSHWQVVQAIFSELCMHFYSHSCCMIFFYCKCFAGIFFSNLLLPPQRSKVHPFFLKLLWIKQSKCLQTQSSFNLKSTYCHCCGHPRFCKQKQQL